MRIQDQLRTPEQRDRLPSRVIRHLGVPDLRGAAGVHAGGDAGKRAFPGCAQEIRLQFDGGEVGRTCGEVGKGPVAACGVR